MNEGLKDQKISYYFRNRKDGEGPVIDDITWNDLDMEAFFGIFNNTCSQNGGEYLYDMLRRPLISAGSEEKLRERSRVAEVFRTGKDVREKYREALKDQDDAGKKSFYEMLSSLDSVKREGNALHYLALLLGIIALALVFINPPVGFVVFLVVSFLNVTTYFKRKGETEEAVPVFRYLIKEIRDLRPLLSCTVPELKGYTDELKGYLDRLKNLERNSWIILTGKKLTGGILELPLDFIRIFFHPDLIKLNSMLETAEKEREAVDGLFRITGFLDACISLSLFRESLDHMTEPVFREEGGLSVKGGYHPLLKEPVPFDLEDGSLILITGSNASGKSTFLKSAALLLLLAETVYTVPAEAFSCRPVFIMTSMSIRDDIMGGDSLYTAEVRSVKRITEEKERGTEVAVFLDEVFKGTNTVERIASLSVLLKTLSKDSYVFAATHDTPLTYILEDIYSNYHFDEEITETGIAFPYELKKGRTESRDAIKLLSLMGFGRNITDRAFALSDRFLSEGIWEKL